MTTTSINVSALTLQEFIETLPDEMADILLRRNLRTSPHLPFPTLLGEDSVKKSSLTQQQSFYTKAATPKKNHEEVVLKKSNTVFTPNHFLALDEDGRYLASTMRVPKFVQRQMEGNKDSAQLVVPSEIKFLPGSFASVGPLEYDNFYHWMTEGLPRADRIKLCTRGKFKLLLPRKPKRFIKESLKLIGYSEEDILIKELDARYKVEVGIFATTMARSIVQLSPYTYDFYDKMLGSFNDKYGQGRKRKFVVSRSGTFRSIENEQQLIQSLGNEFELVKLEDLSLEDQIDLFVNAETIVAPHGAGLTLLLMAPLTAKVVEIIPTYLSAPSSYWSIAETRGLTYAAALCEADVRDAPFKIAESTIKQIAKFVQ